MLDQNTDRMWYVIGAVIIGAAIILIMNSVFPALFGTIGETFKDKTDDVGKHIDTGITTPQPGGGEATDGVMPVVRPGTNLLTADWLSQVPYSATNVRTAGVNDFSIDVKNGDFGEGRWTGGIKLTPGVATFKPNTDYVLKFEYQKVSGSLLSFGGHIDSPYIRANMNVYVDGKWTSNDFKSPDSAYVGDDTKRHKVEIHFTTGDETESKITDSYGFWIQPNRQSHANVSVNMYDLHMSEVVN